jgi:predicted NAD/FAD-binding protein
VAVIGGGWAGCAAAVELASAGYKVTLLEAARTLGGRARRIETDRRQLDNGQHILLGAYGATLSLLRRLGVDARQALLACRCRCVTRPPVAAWISSRRACPRRCIWPWRCCAPRSERGQNESGTLFHHGALGGLAADQDCSVSELLQRWDQTAQLTRLMWRPLCLAALNTPPQRASAQIFLNVLRDSLGAGRSASDMLLPRRPERLLPEAAASYIGERGGSVRTGARSGHTQHRRPAVAARYQRRRRRRQLEHLFRRRGAGHRRQPAAALLHAIPDADTSACASS